MRSVRVRKPATGVALFPFLAVLICTMGALIVLLILVVQQARVQAHVDSRDRAVTARDEISPDELGQQREDHEWRREILEQQRAELTQKLADERLDLGYLEDHIRRLQDEWKALVAQAEELNRTGKAKPSDSAAVEAEQARLKQSLELAKRELEESQQRLSNKPRSFAIIPYKGPNGTHRRPIYIECRGDAIIFQPEGITLGPADFDGPQGPGNPFDAALRATREYLAAGGGNQGGEPYPLLVVRPDGAVAYALARSAMKSWDDEFGYELIDQEMKLAFPPADAQLGAILNRALADARRRQEMLARVAPSRFKGFGSSHGRGEGGGEGEGFNDRFGAGDGSGNSSGSGKGSGNGTGVAGRSGVGGGAGSGRPSGTGGLAAGDGRTGSFGAGGTKTLGSGGGAATGATQGSDNSLNGAGGIESGGSRGAGPFYSGQPVFGQPGPIASASRNGAGNGTSKVGSPNARHTTSGGEFGGGKSGASGSAGSDGTGSAGSDVASSAGSPGASAQSSPSGSPGGTSGGSTLGSSSGMPSITLGQDPSQSGSSAKSSTAKGADRKPSKSRRTPNWGLPNSADSAVGYTRPIRIACSAQKLVVLPERGDGHAPQVVPLVSGAPTPVEDFVGAVWTHMDRWGSAGHRAYWKPVLSVQVSPGGEERFAELESQLQGSGLEVKRK